MSTVFEICGDFGFLVKFVPDTYLTSFEVDEVISRNTDGTIYETEFYLKGFIKRDACSHFIFGSDDHYMHFCGLETFKRHNVLMEFLYNKSFELMREEPEEQWDDVQVDLNPIASDEQITHD